jgi:streptothricin acetyltransferase
MSILVEKATPQQLHLLNRCDNAFQVDSRLILHVEDGIIQYQIVPTSGFTKQYPYEDQDFTSYLNDPDKAVFFAFLDGQLAGQIALKVNWNRFGIVDDLAVEPGLRRQGIGRRLMEKAIEWAEGKGLPGLMLETSDINTNACRFYKRMGFVLGGFDRFLYKATLPDSDEIALYWYLIFQPC